METSLEEQLLELYRELELPRGENHCGSCRTCCTAAGLSTQKVTGLELAVLGDGASDFARYAARERREDGSYLFPECPNLGSAGCRVYERRPFSCRVFGHYRPQATTLPPECVFLHKDIEFPTSQYYEVVPGARRLRELSRDYQLRQVPTATTASNSAEVGLNLEDPWDRALAQVLKGELPDLPAEAEGESLFSCYVRALVAGERGQHQLALRLYSRLVSACPARYDLMTFAGFHAFQAGQMDEAEDYWLQSLRLCSQNPLTFSFLGYLFLHRQQWQLAADFFGAALELEPAQPIHAQRRDEALARIAKP